VYLAYVYNFSGAAASGNGCVANDGGCYFTTRVVRYEYNAASKTLINASILCDSIPGSSDHNSGRMTIAPINGVNYLFYTVGDMGGGQFSNSGRPIKAQATDSYEGKVLRFNLVPDADADTYDRWIPNDNPFNIVGKQNAVWTVGHRNAQGITYGEAGGVGRIYTDEHGAFSDDEVNIEEAGKNYGHPLVPGKNDGNYNNASVGASCNTSLPNDNHSTAPIILNENTNVTNIGANFRPPIFTFYSSDNAKITGLYNQQITNCGSDNNTWDSEAPSSILMYTNSTIPGWKRCLFIPTLKGGKVIRLVLNAVGNGIVGDTVGYFRSANRYRDIAFSPDGYKIYLAVDSSSITSGPSATNPVVSTNRGSILEFTYVSGGVLALQNVVNIVPTKKNYVLSISPVPTNNLLNVKLKSGTAKPLHYELKDLTGMIVLQGEKAVDDFSLSLLPLKAGMYFLQLIDANGQVLANEKVMKM
jgi:PQQ-dependent dehydrogenase (s-GDH family)